jgi:hypothetical protein
MTRYVFPDRRKNLIFKSFIFLSVIFYASALYAQSPVNFSGVWILDNAKSDVLVKDYNITCTINQTPDSISIRQTFFAKNGKEDASLLNSFTLDGKVKIKEEYEGVNRESAKWSPDKKILTTTSTRTVGKDVYGSTDTYTLSGNGFVLTIQTSDINPAGKLMVKVFNKKQ